MEALRHDSGLVNTRYEALYLRLYWLKEGVCTLNPWKSVQR